MAQYVKNEINFHGARSRTRVADNRNSNQQGSGQTRNQNGLRTKASSDGFWGSTDNLSQNAGDGNWGDASDDTPAQDSAWGQDRIVHGMSKRNQRFRSNRNTRIIHISGQLPHWGDVDTEFPALGSKPPPVENVWEKRREKFEENQMLAPLSQTEEERMIQKAMELSKMDIRKEEDRKRQFEEEYRLQTELLQSNPELFPEFLVADSGAAASSDVKKPELKNYAWHSDYHPRDDRENEHCNDSNSKGGTFRGAELPGKKGKTGEKSNNKKTKKQTSNRNTVELASETTKPNIVESVFEEEYRIQMQKLEANPELYEFLVTEGFGVAASSDVKIPRDTRAGDLEQDHEKEGHDGEDKFWDAESSDKQEAKEQTNEVRKQTNKQKAMNSASEIAKKIPVELPPKSSMKSVSDTTGKSSAVSVSDATKKTSTKQTYVTVKKSSMELPSEAAVKSSAKLPSETAQRNPQKTTGPNIPKVVEMFGGWGIKPKMNVNARASDPRGSVDQVIIDSGGSTSKVESNKTNDSSSAFSKSTTSAAFPKSTSAAKGLNEDVQSSCGTNSTDVSSKSKRGSSKEKEMSMEWQRNEMNLTDKPKHTLANKEPYVSPKIQSSISLNKKEYGAPSKPFRVISHDVDNEIPAPQHGTSHSSKETALSLESEQNVVAQKRKYDTTSNISNSASLQTQINSADVDTGREYPPRIDYSLKTIVSDYADLALKCKESSDNDKTVNMKLSKDHPTISTSKSKTEDIFSVLATATTDSDLNKPKTLLNQIETTFMDDRYVEINAPFASEQSNLASNTYSNTNNSITYSLSNNTPEIYSKNNALLAIDSSTDLQRTDASASLSDPNKQSLPFGGFAADDETSTNDGDFSHIEPPQPAPLPMPSPEFPNMVCPPYMDPRMTGFMNPNLMMGMDPFLMQQMMLMLKTPSFMRELKEMQLYYASVGMHCMVPFPLYPQPMIPTPQFIHDPNQQRLSTMVGQEGMSPTSELKIDINPPIPPPCQRFDSNSDPAISPPGLGPELVLPEVAPKVPRYNDESWLNGFISDGLQYGDQSTFIPPPMMEPTPTDSVAISGPSPDMDSRNKSAFTSGRLEQVRVGPNICDTQNPTAEISNGVAWSYQPKIPAANPVCNKSIERLQQPLVAESGTRDSGWGSLDNKESGSVEYSSNWDDSVDGWGSEESTTTRSMRNSSRYVSANAATRQPASQPQVRQCRMTPRGK